MRLALPSPTPEYDRRDQSETRRALEAELLQLREAQLVMQKDLATLKARLTAAGIP
jgi:hypothetical protein